MLKRFLIAVAFVAFAVLRGASPAWAEGAGYTPACASPPCLAPLLLRDAAETEKYVEAFPFADYERHVVPRPPWSCPLKGWAHCLSIWWRTPQIGRFWIEPPPRDLIKGTLADGLVWEPHVVRNLQAHVVPGSVALDVGAYIGTHALLMGRLAGPEGRVYAFEPQRKAYRELRRNIELNELANVTTLRYAVGAETRIVEMNPSKKADLFVLTEKGEWDKTGRIPGESGLSVGAGGDRAELRPLDSFGFRNVSLLKIDVEGFEDEVLAGAERLIRDSRPVILLEILGGKAYPGAPTQGFHPPARHFIVSQAALIATFVPSSRKKILHFLHSTSLASFGTHWSSMPCASHAKHSLNAVCRALPTTVSRWMTENCAHACVHVHPFFFSNGPVFTSIARLPLSTAYSRPSSL